MHPHDRAAGILICVNNWRADADHYTGSRRQWRLDRATHLEGILLGMEV